jgi:hypothetical protein
MAWWHATAITALFCVAFAFFYMSVAMLASDFYYVAGVDFMAAMWYGALTIVGMGAVGCAVFAVVRTPWTLASDSINDRWVLAALHFGVLVAWTVMSPLYMGFWWPARALWEEMFERRLKEREEALRGEGKNMVVTECTEERQGVPVLV